VEDVQSVIKTVDVEGVSSSLSGAFGREEGAVERVVRVLFRDIYRPEDLTSVEGLARIWVRQAAGLPEKDRVDIGKAAELFEECAGLMENHWRGLVKTVETKVGENLRPFVSKEGIGKRNKEQEI